MKNIKTQTMTTPLMQTYQHFPINAIKGKKNYLWDDKGKKYLDFTSGIAVLALGHQPKTVLNAIEKQLHKLWHCSNLYHIPQQRKLANQLTKLTCFDQVFFCNSGAEANEAAFKLARRYANLALGKKVGHIISFKNSFHGRTLGTLTATGQMNLHKTFGPMLPGFSFLPYNDKESLNKISQDKNCIAVILELVQGEGGIIPANKKWIQKLAKICSTKQILLIVDEVQTGIGRTGSFYAYQQYGIKPDILTSAKALASGFPIGAMMAKKKISSFFTPGTHGSTFGGNPLVMTAGIATINAINKNNILKNCQIKSKYIFKKLNQVEKNFPKIISQVRGLGLMIGIKTKLPAIQIVNKLRDNYHLLILTAGKNVVRILPPLTVKYKQINYFIYALTKTFKKMEKNL